MFFIYNAIINQYVAYLLPIFLIYYLILFFNKEQRNLAMRSLIKIIGVSIATILCLFIFSKNTPIEGYANFYFYYYKSGAIILMLLWLLTFQWGKLKKISLGSYFFYSLGVFYFYLPSLDFSFISPRHWFVARYTYFIIILVGIHFVYFTYSYMRTRQKNGCHDEEAC